MSLIEIIGCMSLIEIIGCMSLIESVKNYFLHEPRNEIFPSISTLSEKSKCLRFSRRQHSRPLFFNESTTIRKVV